MSAEAINLSISSVLRHVLRIMLVGFQFCSLGEHGGLPRPSDDNDSDH